MKQITGHLVAHKKDYSSRRGLMRKVSERRRLIKYMKREDAKGFAELNESLKLA